MSIRVHPSNKHCVAKRVKQFRLPAIKKEILRGDGAKGSPVADRVSDGFMVRETRVPASKKTVFKTYENGRDLLIAVCLQDIYDRGQGVVDPLPDSCEVMLDPYHDRLSSFHWFFHVDQFFGPAHHTPYPAAHSTAFPFLEHKKYSYTAPSPEEFGGLERYAWCFIWFNLDDVFRRGPACGINIGRAWPFPEEVTSWNHGTCPAVSTSYGTLYKGRGPVVVQVAHADVDGDKLVVEGTFEGKTAPEFQLLDPCGEAVRCRRSGKANNWRLRASLKGRQSGRYRLIPQAGRRVEPEYFAVDVILKPRPFTVGFTFDVGDDIMTSELPYTPEALAAEMKLMADTGFTRVHWVDRTPERLFLNPIAKVQKLFRETYRNCGDIMPLAAKLAKAEGLEFIGVHKTFDIAADRPGNPGERGKSVTSLRNVPLEARQCIRDNQAATMQLHPEWHQPSAEPVTKLCVYSREPIPEFKRSELRLWTSLNNRSFKPYRGKITIATRKVRRPHQVWTAAGTVPGAGTQTNWVLELSGLKVTDTYVVIDIRKDATFVHRTYALVEAYDATGRIVPNTIGTRGGDHRSGIMFYREWGPGWMNRSQFYLEDYRWGKGAHGLALKRHPNLPTLLEPSYDAAREVWLWHVHRILNTAADGLSIRTLCQHNNIPDYMLYAFAEPVRETFHSMYGRAVTPSWQDCERVRRIRGDFYTEFFRAAHKVTAAAGKKLIAHLEHGIEVPPQYDQRMEIHLDWPTWIREGLIDEGFIKNMGSQDPYIHENVLPLAKQHDTPMTICASNASSYISPRFIELTRALVEDARAAGFDGYIFYEAASFKYRNSENIPVWRKQAGEAYRAVTAVGDV